MVHKEKEVGGILLSPSSGKTCTLIPFYNEKNTIKEIILNSLKYTDFVVAVNDGSTDGSKELIPSDARINLVNIFPNKGKGNALKEGFIKCIQEKFSYVITIDADMQHPPELIPLFLKESSKYDIVIGNRMNNKGKMPIQRILSNKITSALLSVKTGYKILDSQCGFRIYKTSILPYILTEYLGYEAESEILVKAARNKFTIGFLNIPAVYSNEKSKMNPIDAIMGFIKVIVN